MTDMLAVIEFGHASGSDGRRYPTVVIDTTGRPDIADLPRVHLVEGVGDISTSVLAVPIDEQHTVLVMTVSLTRPVTGDFSMAFLLPDHLPILRDAARAGSLLIATSAPSADGGDNPPWLAVDLDGQALLDVLAQVGQA